MREFSGRTKTFSFLLFIIPLLPLSGISKLENSALKGNLDAQLLLGNLFATGSPKERQKALFWMIKAGKQGDAIACLQVGRAYFLGFGTHKNNNKALHWLYNAAALSNHRAFHYIGEIFEEENKTISAFASYMIAQKKGGSKETEARLLRLKMKIGQPEKTIIQKEMENIKAIVLKIPSLHENFQELDKPKVGKKLLSDGTKYMGSLLNGKPHGFGIKTSSDGSFYQGDFADGLENGFGTSFSKKGVITHQGMWSKGKPRKQIKNE